jgi:hypothetical protein
MTGGYSLLYGIGLSYNRPPGYIGSRAGTTTQCHSRLSPLVRCWEFCLSHLVDEIPSFQGWPSFFFLLCISRSIKIFMGQKENISFQQRGKMLIFAQFRRGNFVSMATTTFKVCFTCWAKVLLVWRERREFWTPSSWESPRLVSRFCSPRQRKNLLNAKLHTMTERLYSLMFHISTIDIARSHLIYQN